MKTSPFNAEFAETQRAAACFRTLGMALLRPRSCRYALYLVMTSLCLVDLVGCASMGGGTASPAQHSSRAPQPEPEPIIQLSSFHSLDPDLHDPLVAAVEESGSSLSRWQVHAQTMARTAYDDVVGIVNRSHKRRWDDWAAASLQDGDVVFLQGASNKVVGFIDFSKLSQEVTNSHFTHVGVVAIEEGRAYIYDVDRPGPGRIPFGTMVASPHVKAVAVK